MMKRMNRRELGVIGFGALGYALLYAFLSQIDERGACAMTTVLIRLVPAYIVAIAALILLLRLLPHALDHHLRPCAQDEGAFRTGAAFLLILLAYVPMLLTHYPGSFMYDTQRQTFQIAGDAYDMFHPLLHTLLIRFALSFYDLFSSFEKCAALYCVIQMTVLAACFAQTCASIARMRSRCAARVALLFFMLYPSHMAMAINCVKDTLFSGFFALFITLCMEWIYAGRTTRSRMALCVACGVLACLLRNNMIYAMLVWLVILLIWRRQTRQMILVGIATIVLSQGINAGLGAATNAAHGSIGEMLSVPCQQLARAYQLSPQCFTAENMETMQTLFPAGNYVNYEPTLADPVKNQMDTAFIRREPMRVFRLWLNVGLRCPNIYLDAFLNLALPSLYPYSQYRVAQPYIEVGIQNGVLTAPFGQPEMTSPVRFEPIRTWLDEHIWTTGADDVHLVRFLFNTGAIFWLCGLCVLYAAYRGEKKRLLVLMLPVLLYMTYLLGPVMQGRYLYPFVCLLPTLLMPARQRCGE